MGKGGGRKNAFLPWGVTKRICDLHNDLLRPSEAEKCFFDKIQQKIDAKYIPCQLRGRETTRPPTHQTPTQNWPKTAEKFFWPGRLPGPMCTPAGGGGQRPPPPPHPHSKNPPPWSESLSNPEAPPPQRWTLSFVEPALSLAILLPLPGLLDVLLVLLDLEIQVLLLLQQDLQRLIGHLRGGIALPRGTPGLNRKLHTTTKSQAPQVSCTFKIIPRHPPLWLRCCWGGSPERRRCARSR